MITFTYKPRPALNYKNTDVHEFTPIPFCFVGPRGVGKTSLLASMYQEIKKGGVKGIFIDNVNSEKGADTLSVLNEAHTDMLEMIDETEKGQIVRSVGIGGSQDLNIFEFMGKYKIRDNSFFGSDFKEFRFPFHFIDFPGIWYMEKGTNKEKATEALKSSVVSFLAVDTPALMKGGATSARKNMINTIEGWFASLKYVLAANGHAVIFVLSKAEKYWNDFDELKQKMEECYGTLIATLKNAGVGVYATKIKTLGGIEFSHYDEKNNPKFMRTGDYKPENCATPLQLALKHGLVHVAKKMPKSPLDTILDLLGLSNRQIAIKSAETLAEELNKKLQAGNDFNYIKL